MKASEGRNSWTCSATLVKETQYTPSNSHTHTQMYHNVLVFHPISGKRVIKREKEKERGIDRRYKRKRDGRKRERGEE